MYTNRGYLSNLHKRLINKNLIQNLIAIYMRLHEKDGCFRHILSERDGYLNFASSRDTFIDVNPLSTYF